MRTLSNRVRRSIAVTATVVGMVAVGATGASAWTFATTGAPQSAISGGASVGDGAGSIYRSGFAYVKTDAKLKDPVSNGRGVFQETYAYNSKSQASGQTGRRTGSTWASMQQTSLYSYQGFAGATARSKVCEDASLRPDVCSSDRLSGI